MRLFQSKYIYLYVLLISLIAAGLQGLWIRTLYRSQEEEVRTGMEHIVNEASMRSIYQSLGGSRITNKEFREFLLSPQWVQLRNAFDNSKINGLKSFFEYDITPDSIELEIRFKLNHLRDSASGRSAGLPPPVPPHDSRDSASLHFMDSTVHALLRLMGGVSGQFYTLYGYGRDTLVPATPHTLGQVRGAEFRSNAYSYNLYHVAKYQLVVPSLTGAVLYQLRYFLFSCLLMLLVLSCGLYFLVRFIRMQRLFADARVAFVSNMTHEFKTPVATVTLALESIIKYRLENDREKLYEYVRMSRMELERLNFMIEKVLSLRPGEGEALQMEKIDLRELLQEVMDSLSLQVAARGGQMRLSPCPQPVFVSGDRIHLGNVFFNVLDNALKYTLDAPSIDVRCSTADGRVTIVVSDNGIGIDPLYQKRVFMRFFRVPTSDVHTVKGSGLGLNYVEEVLTRHGGSVRLQSSVGAGSSFFIQLPEL